MPFLDIILVNNYGKTCLCFIALLKNQQIDSFKWALTKFIENLKDYPTVIFSDEEEALLSSANLFFNLF